jgi:hypothetical protein
MKKIVNIAFKYVEGLLALVGLYVVLYYTSLLIMKIYELHF